MPHTFSRLDAATRLNQWPESLMVRFWLRKSVYSDRKVYLELLREDAERCRVAVLGYCLMSNHVHLVLVPGKAEALASALKRTHGRYAAYWNTLYGSSGHVWQGRYYSCPLDHDRLWRALRYTELNPVRAGLVAEARS